MPHTAAATFEQEFGYRAAGVWAAPGRVNVIGEHTDYNDGFVFPMALDRNVTVAAAPRGDGVLNLHSTAFGRASIVIDDIAPGTVSDWPAYAAGVIWALRETGADVGGLDLVIVSDVPTGSGLSSSAALECAVATAAADLYDAGLSNLDLALAAQRAENEVVGVPCGIMDQATSMLATRGHALLLDTRSLQVEQVPLPLEAEGYVMHVIDTRARHRLLDGEYAERRASCEAAAASLGVKALRDVTLGDVEAAAAVLGATGLKRARHIVTENARVLEVVSLLKDGRLDAIGPALVASHESLRDDYEVSVPELDVAMEAALDGGAIGARMTGGGFGGSVIAVSSGASAASVERSVRDAFAAHGFGPPHLFTATPAEGARRLA